MMLMLLMVFLLSETSSALSNDGWNCPDGGPDAQFAFV